MHVHVEQAGQQRALLQVDDAITRGRRAETRFDRDDLACVDDDGLVGPDGVGDTVDDAARVDQRGGLGSGASAEQQRERETALAAASMNLHELDVEHQRRVRAE